MYNFLPKIYFGINIFVSMNVVSRFSGTSKQDNSRHSDSADRSARFIFLPFGSDNTRDPLSSSSPFSLDNVNDDSSSGDASDVINDPVQLNIDGSDVSIINSDSNCNFLDNASVKSRVVHCFSVSASFGYFV